MLLAFFLLNARRTYATVFTSLLKLLNRYHGITAFLSSARIMKTDEGIFSSSEANIRFTCSGHSLSGRFNQAGPVSHSLLLSSSMLIALVPRSAGLMIPLTMKDAPSVPFCIFQLQMLSQLGIFSAVKVDSVLHTTCLQMRQQKHEVWS